MKPILKDPPNPFLSEIMVFKGRWSLETSYIFIVEIQCTLWQFHKRVGGTRDGGLALEREVAHEERWSHTRKEGLIHKIVIYLTRDGGLL